MSFIRPEVQATLHKYLEPIIGLGIALLGLYMLLGSRGLISVLGVGLIGIGLPMIYLSLRRIRLQSDHMGLGVVEVTEREISYMTPQDASTISIDALDSVTVRNAQGPHADMYWLLEDKHGTLLTIPNSAAGSEKLLNGLAALPGVDFDAAGRARSIGSDETIVIWSRPQRRLH